MIQLITTMCDVNNLWYIIPLSIICIGYAIFCIFMIRETINSPGVEAMRP